jgi:hypothetical protein
MFTISYPQEACAALRRGEAVPSKVNGRQTDVQLVEGYLVYTDADGKTNRCKVLHVGGDGDLIQWTCASDGQDPAECVVINPAQAHDDWAW